MTGTQLEGELMTLLMVLGMVLAMALMFEAPVIGEALKRWFRKAL